MKNKLPSININSNKLIARRRRKKADTFQSFLKAADIVGSMMSITDILLNLCEIAKELLGCDSCITFIWDDDEVFRAGESAGLTPEQEAIFKSLRIQFDAMPAFSMIAKGQDVIVENTKRNSFFNRRTIDLFNIKSVLCTPIILRNRLLGSLMIVYKKSSHRFTAKDSKLAHGIAHYAASALHNALLGSEIKDLLIHTVIALASAIDAKSSWTQGHSERVSDFIVSIGIEMGMQDDEIEGLRLAGLLHDIGKLGIPEGILNKPGRLTEKEYELVKKHPLIGVEILSPIKQFRSMIAAVATHHERYDGRGYPKGLKGKDIPLVGRIMAIADAYESMTADRPYRKPRSQEEIINELIENKGTQFDPEIVEIFLRVLQKS